MLGGGIPLTEGELSRKQFSVLTFLESNKGKTNQREIAEKTEMSVGSVNRILTSLMELGYVQDYVVTEAGLAVLEPYRVKRAVFIAAGFGSRLRPLTLKVPKPLIPVNGVRIIDTLLDAVIAAGIEEIIIVRGYFKEQFNQLKTKYPMIRFIDNPYYGETNNICTALYARHYLQNAYVLESDLVLFNPKLIRKYEYSSNYLGVPVERTDDWCFGMKNKIITKLSVGGTNCYHMFGISYWNAEDGAKLSKDIRDVFTMPGGKERYWDQVALEYCIQNYHVEVRPCTFDDIAEVDTYSDLRKLDNTY